MNIAKQLAILSAAAFGGAALAIAVASFADTAPIGTVSTTGSGAGSVPIATATVAGKVKVGAGLGVTTDGTLSVTAAIFPNRTTLASIGAGPTYKGQPIAPLATTLRPGLVKVGTGLSVLPDGTLNNTGVAGVASFKGRGGAVLPAADDYSIGQISGAAAVAATGSYSDLSGKPVLAPVATSGSYTDLTGRPSLAAVATSGSYIDLSNKPSIPAAQVASDWNASSGVTQILNKPTIPSALSQLTQSSSFRTVTDAEKSTWNSGAAPVTSVFGRTGAIVKQAGDYTATDVGADPLGAATSVQANLDALTTSLGTAAFSNRTSYPRTANSATTPADTDKVPLNRGGGWWGATWSALKSTLKSYFDGFYGLSVSLAQTCVGDGVANDATCFQAALNSLTSGKTLDGAGKTYLLSANIASNTSDITIKNLTFSRNVSGELITVNGAGTTFDRVSNTQNFPSNTSGAEIAFSTTATGSAVKGGKLYSNGPGQVIAVAADDVKILGNGIYGSNSASVPNMGIWCDHGYNSTTARVSGLVIAGNTFKNHGINAIYGKAYNGEIIGNTFSNNHLQTSPTGGGQINILDKSLTKSLSSWVIGGNTFTDGGGFATYGIESDASNVTIAGNYFRNNVGTNGIILQTAGIVNNSILGNIIAGTRDAVVVNPNISDFDIRGNTIINNTRYGVWINPGTSDDYQIVNNRFKNNATADILDGGTGTHKTVQLTANSAALPASTFALADSTTAGIVTVSGNTSKAASVLGTLSSGHCASIDADGNIVDAGAACGTTSGGITSIGSSSPTSLTGFLKGNGSTVFADNTSYEPALGNPGTSGSVLASTTGGARSWAALPTFPSGAIVGTTDTQTLSGKTLTAPVVDVLKPVSDSTAAVKVTKADGTTSIFSVDSTNSRVGVNVATPTQAVDILGNMLLSNTLTAGFAMKTTGATYSSTLLSGGTGNPSFIANWTLAGVQSDATKPSWGMVENVALDKVVFQRAPAGNNTLGTLLTLWGSGGASLNPISGSHADPGAGNLSVSNYIIAGHEEKTASYTVSMDSSRITLASSTAVVTLPKTLKKGEVSVIATVAGAAASGVSFTAESGGSVSFGDAGSPTFTNSKTADVVCISQNTADTTTAAWRCTKGGDF